MKNCLAGVIAVLCGLVASSSYAQDGPDILVLGDSQISFGAGASYLQFFNQLPQHCTLDATRRNLLEKLGQSRTAAIGVRSTSLQSWTARRGAQRGAICDVDKKYGVNAGVYGIQGNNDRQFVQIGRGADYQFCAPNRSAFESAFASGNYKPKLLVLAFLGNSEVRWADDRAATEQDVRRTIAQIPDDVPCIFLTTAPVFLKETNDRRVRAQDGVVDAFGRLGGHCEVVAGLTPEVRAVIEGKSRYFRRNDAGRVIDPHHPQRAATDLFLEINKPKLCEAVFSALND